MFSSGENTYFTHFFSNILKLLLQKKLDDFPPTFRQLLCISKLVFAKDLKKNNFSQSLDNSNVLTLACLQKSLYPNVAASKQKKSGNDVHN